MTTWVENASGQKVRSLGTSFLSGSAQEGVSSVAWNGRSDSDAVQADGKYYVKIQAVDAAGNKSEIAVSSAVEIDTTSPKLDNISTENLSFSSNAGNAKDTVTVGFSSDIGTKTNVFVYSETGALVKQILSDYPGNGTTAAVWDGTDSSGAKAPQGVYRIDIKITDEAGNVSTKTIGHVIIDNTSPVLSSAMPALSTIETKPVISFHADDPAPSSGINPSSALISIDSGAPLPITSFNANVFQYSPETLGVGFHTVSTTVEDIAGNVARLDWGFTITDIPNVQMVSAGPTPFNPAINGPAVFRFTSDKNVSVKGKISNQNGAVATIPQTYLAAGATMDLTWDGTWNTDNIVHEGAYNYSFTAVDSYGNVYPVSEGTVKIDTTAPWIVVTEVKPASPNTTIGSGEQATVKFHFTDLKPF